MRIGILFGGDGEERDVSIASASQVVPALRSRGHDVLVVDTATGALTADDERAALTPRVGVTPPASSELERLRRTGGALRLPRDLADVDVVFLALHGGTGENGEVQALLELARIPYTGSGPLGSGMAMDKDVAKRLFHAAGIRTPDWMMGPVDPERVLYRLELPLIVKPNEQGSTVGLTLVDEPGQLEGAIELAGSFGDILFEQFIAGRELTVGVLDGVPLAVGEIKIDEDAAFTYSDKYQAGAVDEIFPADLPPAVADEVRQTALSAHRSLKLRGYSRADFRLDRRGRLWLIEVNTLPGLTATSLLPQSAAAAGIDYATLCERICEIALRDYRT